MSVDSETTANMPAPAAPADTPTADIPAPAAPAAPAAAAVPAAAPSLLGPGPATATATPVFVSIGDAPPASDWLGRNLYVRRLPPVNPTTGEMPSELHVHALFSRFGDIERIKVIRDRHTGLPVGHALVLFKEASAAHMALQTVNASGIGAVATMWLPKHVLYAGAGAV